MSDVTVERDDAVVTIALNRGPHNFLDTGVVRDLADAFAEASATANCILLRAHGRNFSGGRDFSSPRSDDDQPEDLYREAARLLGCPIPVVAAVTGAAVGAGLGLALVADLRVGSPETRFEAPFAKLGTQQGFALTHTLAAATTPQIARRMLLTGAPVHGEEARRVGLLDVLVPDRASIHPEALALARRVASYPRGAVAAIRRSLLAPTYDPAAIMEAEAAGQRALRDGDAAP